MMMMMMAMALHGAFFLTQFNSVPRFIVFSLSLFSTVKFFFPNCKALQRKECFYFSGNSQNPATSLHFFAQTLLLVYQQE